jgi:signal transduction histidine kinase
MFQSARELLFNVVKHSQARSACVTVRRSNGSLQLTISDLGIGFDPEAMLAPGEAGRGFGLFSIREATIV